MSAPDAVAAEPALRERAVERASPAPVSATPALDAANRSESEIDRNVRGMKLTPAQQQRLEALRAMAVWMDEAVTVNLPVVGSVRHRVRREHWRERVRYRSNAVSSAH